LHVGLHDFLLVLVLYFDENGIFVGRELLELFENFGCLLLERRYKVSTFDESLHFMVINYKSL
jgi:hypothetical protein